MESFLQKIANQQKNYYDEHGKNMFFKKNQKQDCAEAVCRNIGFDELLQKTSFIIPNTNKVYFDYTVFKVYATPEHFVQIVDYVYQLCLYCSQTYGTYEIHVNLLGFTISAYDRYKEIIRQFCDKCVGPYVTCCETIEALHIHNCPQIIDQVVKVVRPMISPIVSGRTKLHSKQEGLPDFLTNL